MDDTGALLLPDDVTASDELLDALLDVSQTGLILFRPLYDVAGQQLVDLAYEYLNPAAQRMLRQPARPAESFLTLYPHAKPTGIFDFYRDAFLAAADTHHRQFNYQLDGLDGYFYLSARPYGPLLLVSFTDTNDTPRTAMEEALRQSQRAELQAREAAETERNLLQALLTQAPVAIALFQGEDCTITAANDRVCAMWGYPPTDVLGQPLVEAVPEVRGQGFDDLIREVARTRQPFVGQEMPAQLRQPDGQLETRYFNFVFQPLYDADRQLLGVLDIAVDVTEQMRARQQVQDLNEELAAINEELQAANEEYLTVNTQLLTIQQQLRQLNDELEHRVAQRTDEVQRALAETDYQRQQARNQQELLGQILGRVPAIIATLSGPNHCFTFFNDQFQGLMADRAQLGEPVAELLPELLDQGMLAMLDRVYRTGRPFEATAAPLVMRGSDGQPQPRRYLDFVCQALLDAAGQPRGLQFFAIDVTEQVLARHEREVRQTELQTIFEQVPVPIVIMRGPALTVTLANQAICNLWGRSPTQVLGLPYFEAVPATAGQGFEEILAGVLATGETFLINESPLHLDRAHTGQSALGYFNFAFQALRDEQRRITGLIAIGIEVTDQVVARQQVQALNDQLAETNGEARATNEQLAETNTRLSRTNADLDTFVYSASHDLKSPITNIEGLLLALREHLPPAARQQPPVPQLLAMMEDAVARFQQTLAHLTDVSRLQQPGPTETAEAIDLPAVVEAVRLDMRPELEAAQATLVTELTGCPTVRFSAKNLRSVIYNLLSNAIKYRAPDRPPLVHLRCHHVADQVILELEDNGLGLTEIQQQELFRLFRRLHSHVPGSGVGLYMVKKMVENAGGTIFVRSKPGTGTIFIVALPVAG